MRMYDDSNNWEFRVNKFTPEMELALDWYELSNGNYTAIDRGREEDSYSTKLITYGTHSYILDMVSKLKENFISYSGIINMSGFVSDEKIFGENINHNIVSGVITNWESRETNSWRGSKLAISLKVLSPTFTGVSRLPILSSANIQYAYKGDSIYDYVYNETYTNQCVINYLNTSTRDFEFSMNLTLDEIRDLRQFMRSNRAESFYVSSIYGVDYPFGQTYSYPHICKLIEYKEGEFFGINRKIVTMVFHKEI